MTVIKKQDCALDTLVYRYLGLEQQQTLMQTCNRKSSSDGLAKNQLNNNNNNNKTVPVHLKLIKCRYVPKL